MLIKNKLYFLKFYIRVSVKDNPYELVKYLTKYSERGDAYDK